MKQCMSLQKVRQHREIVLQPGLCPFQLFSLKHHLSTVVTLIFPGRYNQEIICIWLGSFLYSQNWRSDNYALFTFCIVLVIYAWIRPRKLLISNSFDLWEIKSPFLTNQTSIISTGWRFDAQIEMEITSKIICDGFPLWDNVCFMFYCCFVEI